MKKQCFRSIKIGTAILTFLLAGTSLSISDIKASRNTSLPEQLRKFTPTRSFYMGFCPVPRESSPGQSTTEDWLNTFELLGRNAEFVLHHVHLSKADWAAFSERADIETYEAYAGLEFITLMAAGQNLDVFIVVDPLTDNRQDIATNPFATGFHDPKIRAAFKNFSIRIARDYKRLTNGKSLKFLGLGSEINTYFKFHPNDTANFITLYRETYSSIKSEFPNTSITSTFQYELLNGRYDGNPRWDIILQFGAQLDAVAITTYPSAFFENPDAMPSDYYLRLKQFTKKPVVVAESGWPTAGDTSWHSSEDNQKHFLSRFTELTSRINLKLWIWWFIHDSSNKAYPEYFRSMGLRTSDGKPKSPWETWQSIKARRISKGR